MPIFRPCDLGFVQIDRPHLLESFIMSSQPLKGFKIKEYQKHKADQHRPQWMGFDSRLQTLGATPEK